jgi:hypothetical protein
VYKFDKLDCRFDELYYCRIFFIYLNFIVFKVNIHNKTNDSKRKNIFS